MFMVNSMNNNYQYWKKIREDLTNLLKENIESIEMTPKNVYELYKKIGVKATARYFNVSPSTIKYYLEKYKKCKMYF